MSRLEAAANVVLRVPALALLDVLYRWDAAAVAELLRPRPGEGLRGDALLRPRALWGASCVGHVLCVVLLVLPVRSLVRLYLHLLTALLLCAGHQRASDFVRHELQRGFQGAVYSDVAEFGRFAAILTSVEVLYVLSSHILVPFQLAAAACREVLQATELYRLLALGVSLWSQLSVPLLFLVFWLVLFSLRLSSFLASSGSPVAQQGLLFVLLSSVAECCSTPYSLVGLTFTVSYLALGVLNLCKFYLLGFGAFQNGNVMHRGVTEGVTLLLLALQTGLLDLQVLQRTFLLSIIYCVNAVSRVLEFLVALCVVAYGTWESLFGEWSWMGASVIIIHSYFNVWLRAQSGWRSFLLRREAAKKINSLPRATRGQLRDHNDVCAICFQDMRLAVVTSCNHFFHRACLRKWLYVQDTCPMCHQHVTPAATREDGSAGPAAQPVPAHEDEVPGVGGAPARPGEDGPPPGEPLGGDGGAPGPGDGGVWPGDGAGACGPHLPAHRHPPAPGEEAGAVPQPGPCPNTVPHGDGPPRGGARQPVPSAAATDRSAGSGLGTGRGEDGHSARRLS